VASGDGHVGKEGALRARQSEMPSPFYACFTPPGCPGFQLQGAGVLGDDADDVARGTFFDLRIIITF
jgi:hypothetical protein